MDTDNTRWTIIGPAIGCAVAVLLAISAQSIIVDGDDLLILIRKTLAHVRWALEKGEVIFHKDLMEMLEADAD